MFELAVFDAALRMATPLILAALGGLFSERSGVVNIALEGILLTGAFASIVATFYTGDPWAGAFAGVLAGMLVSLIHAVVSISVQGRSDRQRCGHQPARDGRDAVPHVDHLGQLRELAAGRRAWRTGRFPRRWGPLARGVNAVIGHYPPLVYVTLALVASSHVVLCRTPFGLQAAGDRRAPGGRRHARRQRARMRFAGVLMSGALAGLGGAFLALNTHQFVKNMSAGRGFIALAAMIFGKWNPVGALAACLLFGYAEAVQMGLQGQARPHSVRSDDPLRAHHGRARRSHRPRASARRESGSHTDGSMGVARRGNPATIAAFHTFGRA